MATELKTSHPADWPNSATTRLGIIIASVPMSSATVVSVDAGKGGRPFVRFGDGGTGPTVWQADGYEVVDLLETLLDVPGGREALAKATEPNK